MSQFDEAQLTAYALGELDERARREIEARLPNEPALRAEVEQIRAVAKQLQDELAAEPMPRVTPPLTLAPRRRMRLGARLAIAAAVSVVVGGLAISVMLPSLNRARETAVVTDLSKLGVDHPTQARKLPEQGFAFVDAYPGTSAIGSGFKFNTTVDALPPVAPTDPTKTIDELSLAPASSFQRAERLNTSGVSVSSSAAPVDLGAGSSGQRFVGRVAVPNDGIVSMGGQSIVTGAVRGSRVFDANDQVLTPREDQYGVFYAGTHNTEAYDRVVDNAFLDVIQNPLSTFSIDVDTASYSNMRRFLTRGQRPPKDAVRIEELVNYFPYDYAPPKEDAKDPFAAHVEVAACPWQPEHRLVRVGLKGKEIAADKRPASNLVFLLDVSGSMNQQNKLPLVKRSMRMLLDQLSGEDRVAIVVYAGHSGLALPSTECTHTRKQSVENAIENLSAGGSTNGEQGIQLAYTIAKDNFIEGGTNRVILCTDGDFNVGVTNQGDLTRVIEEKAKGGVFLSVLGFGMGNLKDSTMEKLADKGNGNYAYIDTAAEAKKVLVEQMSGTLVTIAKDVKIQVEFNPAVVGSFRLIGYENRLLAKEDFNDDKKDAGEIGAGHAVTALYEVVPVGANGATSAPAVDALRYQKPAAMPRERAASDEMLTLKLRYKQPDGDTSTLMETPVKDAGTTFARASAEFKFASAVAAFGMILRDSPHKGSADLNAVMEWAEDGLGKDASGYRHEFIDLVKKAKGH